MLQQRFSFCFYMSKNTTVMLKYSTAAAVKTESTKSAPVLDTLVACWPTLLQLFVRALRELILQLLTNIFNSSCKRIYIYCNCVWAVRRCNLMNCVCTFTRWYQFFIRHLRLWKTCQLRRLFYNHLCHQNISSDKIFS